MAGTGSVRGDGEDARRRQLIEATIESLADVGFAACTLMDIARRAGVSPGLVAHYFGDKDGLLEATLRHMAGRISRLVARRLAEATSPRARVQAVIDANLAPEEFDRRTASVWLAFWGQVIHSTRFRRVQNVYQSRMLSNLRHALRQMVPPRDAEQLAVTIAAIIDGLWLRETLVAEGEQEGSGARAIATALVDAELAVIRARPQRDVAPGRADRVVGQHIGGRVVTGGGRARFPAVNPASGETLAEIEVAGPSDVEAAMESARRGQAFWAGLGGRERGCVLQAVANRLRQEAQAMARLEAAETGRPIRYALADIADAAECFDRFATLAALPRVGMALDLGGGRSATLRQVPAGVVVAFGAAMRPLHAASLQLAPALASGNALILKSSEAAPLSVASLAEILTEAGLPVGVFSVLHGPDERGPDLARHRDVAMVAPDVAGAGAATLIVLDDADLDIAVAAALDLAFRAGASVFAGACRVLVQEAERADFVDRLVAAAGRIVTGDPLDPETECSAMIGARPWELTFAAVEKACAAGARLAAGGARAPAAEAASRALFSPTILDVPTDGDLLPAAGHAGILIVAGFLDEADAIRRADRAAADGAAFVFTRDAERGQRVADRLRAASCWINLRGPLPAAFGCPPDLHLASTYTRLNSRYVDVPSE